MARKLKHPTGLRWVDGEMLPLTPDEALYGHRDGEVYIDPVEGLQMQLHPCRDSKMRTHFEIRRVQQPDLFIRKIGLWPAGNANGD
jgi:hypothetical protein